MNFKKFGRTANLFDYVEYFDSTFISYNQFFNYSVIQLNPNTTYTLSTSLREVGTNPRNTPFIVATTNQTPSTASGGISDVSPITITTENDGKLKLYKRISGSDTLPTKMMFDNGEWLMLNTGSTALPYQPYKDWTDIPHYIHNTSTDAITTLPAVIHPTGTTATVGLKGQTLQSSIPSPTSPVMPQECGERTGNLFDKSMADLYNHSTLGQTNTWAYSAESTGVTLRIPCDANTQYTLSISSTIGNTIFRISEASTDDVPIVGDSGGIVCHTILNGGAINNYTFTTASDSKYILFQVNSNVMATALNTLMLSLLPLPHEPYGYKIPISSGGVNLFDKSTTIYYAYINPDGYWTLSANSRSVKIPCHPNTTYTIKIHDSSYSGTFRLAESSDPSVTPYSETAGPLLSLIVRTTNITEYTFTTKSDSVVLIFQGIGSPNENSWIDTLMLNRGSIALPYEPYVQPTETPIYLGEVQTTRLVKKLVLDGTGDWVQAVTGVKVYRINVSDYLREVINIPICTHYKGIAPVNGSGALEDLETAFLISTSGNNFYYIRDDRFNNANDFKSYLAAQYAAGTPVTVWYVLATPETGIVNEPLMKIGEYADTLSNISIPVTAGGDTLSVGTTVQPSEVTVNYKGWHPVSDVHERSSGQWT